MEVGKIKTLVGSVLVNPSIGVYSINGNIFQDIIFDSKEDVYILNHELQLVAYVANTGQPLNELYTLDVTIFRSVPASAFNDAENLTAGGGTIIPNALQCTLFFAQAYGGFSQSKDLLFRVAPSQLVSIFYAARFMVPPAVADNALIFTYRINWIKASDAE